MRQLKSIVASVTNPPPLLPLIHTTTVSDMCEIIRAGVLKPQYCSVFKSDLTYMFYCRPDYKPNSLNDYHTVPAAMPALFAIRGACMANFEISPFDTGAFIGGRFDDHLFTGKSGDKEKTLAEHYQLFSSLDSLPKYIQFMYGSNENYYSIRPSRPPFHDECLAVQNCFFLASQRVSDKYDRRCASLEVRTSEDIAINSTNIAWALIPDDAKLLFKDETDSLGIEVHTYYPPAMGRTDEYVGAIISEYRRILVSKSLL